MRPTIRRVSNKVYDQYATSEYALQTDNLNPVHDTALESQVNTILDEVQKKLAESYTKAGIKPADTTFLVNSPTIEGLEKGVNSLITALNKGGSWPNVSNKNNSPLVDGGVFDKGFADAFGSGALNGLGMFDNPLSLDCWEVDSLFDGKGNFAVDEFGNVTNGEGELIDPSLLKDWDASGTNTSGSYEDDEDLTVYVRYVIENAYITSNTNDTIPLPVYEENADSASRKADRQTLKVKDFPIVLEQPKFGLKSGTMFANWYYDPAYNSPAPSSLSFADRYKKTIQNADGSYSTFGEITLYGKVLSTNSLSIFDTYGNKVNEASELSQGQNDDGCVLQELAILKMILVICKVITNLIKILNIVLGIVLPLIKLIEKAMLVWVDPPMLQEIIQYAMERAMSMVMMIIGMLLKAIFKLLRIECISAQGSDIINQIMEALAGITGVADEIDTAGIQMGTMWETIQEAAKELGQDVKKQGEKIQQSIKDCGSDIRGLGKMMADKGVDIFQALTDPAYLYNNAVPDEIKQELQGLVDTYNSTQQLTDGYNQMKRSWASLFGVQAAEGISRPIFGQCPVDFTKEVPEKKDHSRALTGAGLSGLASSLSQIGEAVNTVTSSVEAVKGISNTVQSAGQETANILNGN